MDVLKSELRDLLLLVSDAGPWVWEDRPGRVGPFLDGVCGHLSRESRREEARAGRSGGQHAPPGRRRPRELCGEGTASAKTLGLGQMSPVWLRRS